MKLVLVIIIKINNMGKKYIYILLFVIIYMGCKQNDIEIYNEDARLNFASGLETKIFRDTDYVRNNLEYKHAISVQIQGNQILKVKSFCLKVDELAKYKNLAEVLVDPSYEYTAIDTNVQFVYVTVKRPKNFAKKEPFQINIKFDFNNPKHQFAKGRVDKDSCRIDVFYDIHPTEWNSWKWGEYSDGKYSFIMDVLRKTYSEINDYDKAYEQVVKQYSEYIKNNPPILDDKGEKIVFP